MITATRKIIKLGKYSSVITLPANLTIGENVTIAGNRLLLIDPRGSVTPEELLTFLETHIEPKLWNWLNEQSPLES